MWVWFDAYYERKHPRSGAQPTDRANWGAKFDAFGNKLAWFGYKVHLAVDAKRELPMALTVTPANVYDEEMAIPLMEELHHHDWRIRFVLIDAGYDQTKNYEAARALGAQAIIPINRRNEKEPPEGMDFDGRPRCTMGYRMTYWEPIATGSSFAARTRKVRSIARLAWLPVLHRTMAWL